MNGSMKDKNIQESQTQLRYSVVVLGDLGHSPRIINQALSLASLPNAQVDLVGYRGSAISPEVLEKANIALHFISSPPSLGPGLWKGWYLLFAPFKALFMFFALTLCLLRTQKADFILIQNPPAIPTLAVVKLINLLRGSSVIIDWHNFGYSILALKFGLRHPVVKIAHFYEWVFGRKAFAHITVTEAMARELKEVWKVKGKLIVLHDRAPSHFRRLEVDEAHATLLELESNFKVFRDLRSHFFSVGDLECSDSRTILTKTNTVTGKIELRDDRPYLLVSSTSWTPDEDFGLLLEALISYDGLAAESKDVRSLAVVITGKGPDKELFETKLEKIAPELRHISLALVWLPIHLYPKLLGLADLGVSLHSSSSGLDLPMKVVDMLGAGLPVCALDFDCMGELISHYKNGLLFSTSNELAAHLELLFTNPRGLAVLKDLREGASDFRAVNWKTHWENIMLPVLNETD